jgi:phage-related protein
MSEALEEIKAIGLRGAEAQELLESVMSSLSTKVDELGGTLKQSSEDLMVRNREMLDGSKEIIDNMLDTAVKTVGEMLPALQAAEQVMKDRTQSILKSAEEHARLIGENVANVSTGLEKVLDRYMEKMANDLSAAMDSNNKLAADLADAARRLDEVGAEQYKKATESAAGLITSIAAEMRSAMSAIGSDIAESINAAYSANVSLVDQLAERTEQLVAEYDNYFNGIEQSTSTVIRDMDSSVSNTVLRLSEEVTGAMDSFNESMRTAMERFETGTSRMIEVFDEQSRDLGLYARELNMDVGVLTANLRESVEVFNKGLNDGVRETFHEFDEGLSEFTARFANTLETIRDSVEALPAALKGGINKP